MTDEERRELAREAMAEYEEVFVRVSAVHPGGESDWLSLAHRVAALARELEAAVKEKEPVERERFALDEAIRRTRATYPEDVFPPDSESVDAKSAAWARMVCDNIRGTAQDILGELEDRP